MAGNIKITKEIQAHVENTSAISPKHSELSVLELFAEISPSSMSSTWMGESCIEAES